MDTILIYVPKQYFHERQILAQIDGSLKKPEEFWLSKPDGWRIEDLATIHVSAKTFAEWSKSSISEQQLLKG